jgi:hypothetical protein
MSLGSGVQRSEVQLQLAQDHHTARPGTHTVTGIADRVRQINIAAVGSAPGIQNRHVRRAGICNKVAEGRTDGLGGAAVAIGDVAPVITQSYGLHEDVICRIGPGIVGTLIGKHLIRIGIDIKNDGP